MKTKHHSSAGFTIVELSIVIVVIGILAGIVIVGYGGWRDSVAKKEVQSDLQIVASAMENAKNFSNDYPSTIPSTFTPSSNVVIEMTTQPTGQYCISGYHKTQKGVRMSISTDNKREVRDYLCVGPSNGSVVGGTVPATPTGVNLAPQLANWTLAGTATYNASTSELTLGTNGSATSPKIKVNGVAGMNVNGQFYATVASTYAPFQPNGGWHSGATYFTADGTSAATNTNGNSSNGCAKAVNLNGWSASSSNCPFALGNNVVYVKIVLYSSASYYASSDLKVKDISFILY